MVNLEGFVPGKRFRWDKMECGRDRLRGDGRRGVGVVRKHVGYGKRVAGKSLDLTVTLVIGNRFGAIVGKPCMDLVAMFALGL